MGTKVGDTRLLQLHYTIRFPQGKASMCGRMPYILFHMPYGRNYHIRIDPDLDWMMANANSFEDAPTNWDSASAKMEVPFRISEVTFESWHFTCNDPQSQCQFDSSHRSTGGDGSQDFFAKANQAARDYMSAPQVLMIAPVRPILRARSRDPFAQGDDFVPLEGGDRQIPISSSPPVNSQYWTGRQQLHEGSES